MATPIAGRGRAEIDQLIGMFVNTLALRTDLDAAESFAGLLGRVREVEVARDGAIMLLTDDPEGQFLRVTPAD